MKPFLCISLPHMFATCLSLTHLYSCLIGKTVPKMDLIRKHLMIEGHVEKECLVKIIQEVTDVYRKLRQIS